VCLAVALPATVEASQSRSVEPPPLESGGSVCYDPHSWVWTAARAERIPAWVSPDAPCEIGTVGCERSPGELGVALQGLEEAQQVCDLKRAQLEQQDDLLAFDTKACLRAESTPPAQLLALESVPPAPSNGLVCGDGDATCSSMPLAPHIALEWSTPAPALTAALLGWLANAAESTPGPAAHGRALRGTHRRVERPPCQA
jgi:hypothetical protein